MGKSRRTQMNYSGANTTLYDSIIKEKGVGKAKKEKLKEILDYCNENNLEMIETGSFEETLFTNGYGEVEKSRLSFRDPDTGKVINIFDNAISGKGSIPLNHIKEDLDRMRDALKDVPSNYLNNIKAVNLHNSGGALGYFQPLTPDAIQLTPSAFLPPGPGGQDYTGLSGTIYHELGHVYDHKNGGVTGGLTEFSKLPNGVYPTRYAQNATKVVNGEVRHYESISTTIEMVGTQKVCRDAKLSNNKYVRDVFRKEQGRDPNFNNAEDMQKMYAMWSNDPEWKPLIAEAKRIING